MNLTRNKSYSIKDYAKREVNLLPNEVFQVSRKKFMNVILAFVVISCVFAFGFYENHLIQETKRLEDDTLYKKAAVAKERNNLDQQEIILSLDNRIAMKEFLLDYIFSTNRSVVEIIHVFESTLNGEVYLNSLHANSYDTFVINASATSHEAISYLINQLKRLKTQDNQLYFESVFTNGITRNEDEEGNISFLFQIECTFEGGLNETE